MKEFLIGSFISLATTFIVYFYVKITNRNTYGFHRDPSNARSRRKKRAEKKEADKNDKTDSFYFIQRRSESEG